MQVVKIRLLDMIIVYDYYITRLLVWCVSEYMTLTTVKMIFMYDFIMLFYKMGISNIICTVR